MSHPDPSEPTSPQEHPHAVARNARYGLWLFGVYVLFYAGFVALSAFKPSVMATDLAGVNLAIVYGFSLILLAFVLAMIYMAMIGRAGDGEDRK